MAVMSRLFLAMIVALSSLVGWGAAAPSSAMAQSVESVRIDPCGDACCCGGPEHCPCVIDVPAPADTNPAPATLPERGERDGARLPASPDYTNTDSDDLEARGVTHAWATLCHRPMGDLSRRVMQLQCVWRT